MGILMEQIISDMEEAMVLEGLGAKIDLLPDGSWLKLDEDEYTWTWRLPKYIDKQVDMEIYFYVDQGMSLTFLMAMQGTSQHNLSPLDQTVVEDAFEWLYVEGKFNVEEK